MALLTPQSTFYPLSARKKKRKGNGKVGEMTPHPSIAPSTLLSAKMEMSGMVPLFLSFANFLPAFSWIEGGWCNEERVGHPSRHPLIHSLSFLL